MEIVVKSECASFDSFSMKTADMRIYPLGYYKTNYPNYLWNAESQAESYCVKFNQISRIKDLKNKPVTKWCHLVHSMHPD